LCLAKIYPLLGLAAAGAGLNPLSPMAKPLTKSQIISAVAETAGLTNKQAAATLEAIVNLAYKNAKNSFTLPGLGKIVGPHRAQPGHRRADQDCGQTRREISRGQSGQGCHSGHQVRFLFGDRLDGGNFPPPFLFGTSSRRRQVKRL